MSDRLPPRPEEKRSGMTRIGALRDDYNAGVEGRPSRFLRDGDSYRPNPDFFAWCARADAWAEAIEAALGGEGQ